MPLVHLYADDAADIEALTPSSLARESMAAIIALHSGIHGRRDRVAALSEAMADVRTASGSLLDLMGETLGEPRAGLEDGEYRRILAAQRVARHGARGMQAIAECFRRIADASAIHYTELGPNGIRMWAHVKSRPTTTFTRRAGVVLGRCIPGQFRWNADLVHPAAMFYDDGPHYGESCYTLRSTYATS